MRKQWTVEVVRCINEWANCGWDANEMTWKNPCTTNRVNQWINESMNQWINESMKQGFNKSVKQRTNKSLDPWANETVSERMNEWMNEWMDGWMDGWMGGLVDEWNIWNCEWASYFFFERFLHWATTPLISATTSLSSILFGLLLLRPCSGAASQLAFLWLLQPNSSLRRGYVAFSNL